VRAFERLHPADGVSFAIRSKIPPAAGLGSSAAAIVAGLCAADHMYELDAPLFELARELEGHPDNVAAALMGGFVVCAGSDPVRFDPPPGLEAVLAIPADPVPTEEARAAMPSDVPLAEAVDNVAHASLLILGLAHDDFSLIGRGLHDRLHQERRRALYPRSMELMERAESLGAVGATISGAGPAVLFWCHWQQTGTLMERLKSEAADCNVRRVQFAPGGADVRAL
jgi:homoserine kinase